MRSGTVLSVCKYCLSGLALGLAVLLVTLPVRATEVFSLALTGDALLTRRLSIYREPAFLRMIELIRGADVAFTNLETLFHNYESAPVAQGGGTYMRSDPALVEDLRWAGFDLLSRANNHALDYGVGGMRKTSEHLDRAGLVHAGVGESLAEAREAKFLETRGGRVALIAVASTFPGHMRAGATRGDIPPRPGLNPLRHSTSYVVRPEQLAALRVTQKSLGYAAPEGDTLYFLGEKFVAGAEPGERTEPNRKDLEAIAAVVSSASRLADLTIVSIHGHERERWNYLPAQFLKTFARAMVDAGADVVVGHGPHVLRGIELYRGKPILYSLGNFIFENETLLRLPEDNYEEFALGGKGQMADFNAARYDNDRTGFPAEPENWESVVALSRWQGKKLVSLTLHPLTLGYGKPARERGRPMLAEGERGRKIIGDLARLSQPMGTEIIYAGGVGQVRLTEGKAAER